jgi:PKD repeat protein
LLVGKTHAWDDLPPIPDINNPYSQFVCVGCPVQFDGSTSYDQDEAGESIEHWYWYYGDDGYWHDDGPTPTHTYNAPGAYLVWLHVEDDEGTESLVEDDDCCIVYVVKVDKVVEAGTTNEGPLYVCPDDTVNLQAKPYPAGVPFPSGEPYWKIVSQPSGANAYLSPSSGSATTTLSSLGKPGEYVVKAKCGNNDTGHTITVKVVEVKSLLPNEGTEIDDGDNEPNTKLFVVCVVPPSPPSTLTVTATPNPSVSEADLPACWTLTGGTGTGKLTRTVDKTTPGETVITCTCNTSMKKTTIWVVRGEVSLASSWACDGQQVNVDLILTPAGVENHITSVQWQATVPSGVTNYGSPSGQGLTFSQRSADITEWRIDNARWYSNQADHCNDGADWEIEAT